MLKNVRFCTSFWKGVSLCLYHNAKMVAADIIQPSGFLVTTCWHAVKYSAHFQVNLGVMQAEKITASTFILKIEKEDHLAVFQQFNHKI